MNILVHNMIVADKDAEIKRLEAEKRNLDNNCVELNAILEAVYDVLDGKEPSDFMQSYPAVDSVWRLEARCKELEADVANLKCCGNCKSFHHCQFLISDTDVIVKSSGNPFTVYTRLKKPENFDCDKWEGRK